MMAGSRYRVEPPVSLTGAVLLGWLASYATAGRRTPNGDLRGRRIRADVKGGDDRSRGAALYP